jgi:ferritin
LVWREIAKIDKKVVGPSTFSFLFWLAKKQQREGLNFAFSISALLVQPLKFETFLCCKFA